MRAGLFLEGLSRSFDVRCLVVPVFGDAGPTDRLVGRLASGFDVLQLDPSPDAVAEIKLRLATPASRARVSTTHPRPALCRQATMAAASAVADAADGVALVHVHRLYIVPFLDVLLDRPERPVLTLDVDDIESTAWRRQDAGDEADAYERLADHYLPAVDHVMAASVQDAADMGARYGQAHVTSVPNAVRLPPHRRGDRVGSSGVGRHDLLFVATLSYPPNVDAAHWLCQDVLPHLPGVSIALVGSNPTSEVRSLARDDRVTVVGPVPDVGPWYNRARVAVVPVRAGGGTRTKLLEALAHGRPVVSTSLGAEGLDLAPGRDGLLVADDPYDFAAACRRLLDHPDLAERLAAAGHDVVAETATVELVAGKIDRLLRSIVA